MKKEKSCGTIIIDNDLVLLIEQKKGFIGFPKGHMEKGETEEETAIRETKEETNLDVTLENKKFTINYIANEIIDKEVVFFIAHPITKDIKYQEAELNNAYWVNIKDVRNTLTFDNTKELWDKVLKELK